MKHLLMVHLMWLSIFLEDYTRAFSSTPFNTPKIRSRSLSLFSSREDLSVSDEVTDFSQFSEKQLSVFSSSTRLLAERRYAKRGPYLPAKILTTPTILDLSPPRKLTSSDPERTWLSLQFRASVCISAYLAFPYIIKFIMPLVDQSTFELQQVVSSFVPGISILFGTLCSLTANILYQRQARLQQTVSEESAVLAQLTQDFLTLHKRPEHTKQRIRAAQAAADYTATLVGDSRGTEIMRVAISDPIAVMTDSVSFYEQWCEVRGTDLQSAGALVGSIRNSLTEIGILRARRLSDEALALPPTHFLILGLLSSLILAGFVLASLGSVTIDPGTKTPIPSFESKILFAILTGVYTLFFNFSRDLNSPFEGVYQIRRSQTAASLIKTKRIITSSGLASEIDFGYSDNGDRTV